LTIIKLRNKKKIITGIWFFGPSGCGKTFASKFISRHKKNNIIIDGDVVRKYISFDLGYSKQERDKQIKRVYGIAKIAIKSKLFPIIAVLWMNNEVAKMAKLHGIKIVKIERDLKKIIKNHKTYKNKKNVVSVDIDYPIIKTKLKKVFNTGDKSFYSVLRKLI